MNPHSKLNTLDGYIMKMRKDLEHCELVEKSAEEYLKKSLIFLAEKKLRNRAVHARQRCDALKAELCDMKEEGIRHGRGKFMGRVLQYS